jgi:hypothetical protein
MGQVMNAGTMRWSCWAASSGRLLALVAAGAFLIAALTGNAFSLHLGMTASASDTAVAVDTFSHAAAVAGPLSDGVGDVASDASAPMPAGSHAQHLMHLIGACLAVIGIAVLVWVLIWGRIAGPGHPFVTAIPRLVGPPPVGSWRPPPLVPPRSSPVIRT